MYDLGKFPKIHSTHSMQRPEDLQPQEVFAHKSARVNHVQTVSHAPITPSSFDRLCSGDTNDRLNTIISAFFE